MTLSQWEEEIIAEVLAEVSANDPIHRRFVYVAFVSTSKGRDKKGRGKKRRYSTEVELIRDREEPYKRFYSWNRFPFDEKATDVYQGHNIDGLEMDAKLRREIPERGERC